MTHTHAIALVLIAVAVAVGGCVWSHQSHVYVHDPVDEEEPTLEGRPEWERLGAEPEVSPADLQLDAEKRRRARALVDRIAEAGEEDLSRIENDLADIGPQAMVPLKIASLSDNFELRKRAGRIAGRLRWRLVCPAHMVSSHPTIVAVMSGSDRRKRASLVDKVFANAGPRTVPFFIECFADTQTYVRQRAVDGLVRGVNRASGRQANRLRCRVAKLLHAATSDPDRDIRLMAIAAMAKIQAVNVLRLAELLDDESMEVRTTVIRTIGRSRNRAAARRIRPCLKDQNWRIRAAALQALDDLLNRGTCHASVSAVFEKRRDKDSFVRALAASVLEDWGYSPDDPSAPQSTGRGHN